MLHFPRWKVILVLLVCLGGLFLALPNFLPNTWFPRESKLNLGLDLRGGSYLLLGVGFDTYLQEQYASLLDDARVALRKERIGYLGLSQRQQGVSFSLRNVEDAFRVEDIIRELSRDIAVDQSGTTITLTYREDALDTMQQNVLDQSIEIVRRRVDETGTREPIIQRQGDDRILLQVPGLQDPEQLKRLLGKTAKLTFHLMDAQDPFPGGPRVAPPGTRLLTGTEDAGETRYYLIKKRIMLSGDMLVNASSGYDNYQRPAVFFRFNNRGGRIFANVTKEHVAKPFAIVLDNEVISAPVIEEPILGGSGQITGNFTVQSASDLALLLRAGALPAPLAILEERTVGPSLGQDSIDAGTNAALIGLVGVIIFMILSYGLFGIFSNIALAMNLLLLVGALSLFQATLTLPGIAGIVLTMGMAVDANVLIFERIREEMNLGKTPIAAVDHGFRQAFKTILDSNVTTLIATLLLFMFGSGPVKGFAVTLSLGIIASMFSAIMLTRLMVVTWLRRTKPSALPI